MVGHGPLYQKSWVLNLKIVFIKIQDHMLLVSCILNIHTHVGLSKLANKLAQQSQFVSCVKDVVLTSRFIAKLKHTVYFHRCIQCPLFFRVVGWIVFQRILRQQMRVYLHMCAICKAYLRAKYQSAKLDLTITLPKKKLSIKNKVVFKQYQPYNQRYISTHLLGTTPTTVHVVENCKERMHLSAVIISIISE